MSKWLVERNENDVTQTENVSFFFFFCPLGWFMEVRFISCPSREIVPKSSVHEKKREGEGARQGVAVGIKAQKVAGRCSGGEKGRRWCSR